MRRSEAKKLRRIIEQAMDAAVEDAAALEAVVLFPQWDQDASYEAGMRVRFAGVLYRCLQAHRAQADWTPGAAGSLWARVLVPDGDEIPDWVQPDSTNPYEKGARVRHQGRLWVSVAEHNVWEPGVYGWEEIGS